MAYHQLTLQDRYYIEIEMKNGTSHNKIAKALNRSQWTISKEIARNKGKRGYRHKQADRTAKNSFKLIEAKGSRITSVN